MCGYARWRERIGESTLRPRVAQSLHENAELLRTFKRVATLVEIEVKRPPDKPTDFAGGAAMAREIGMNRLAERLASKRRKCLRTRAA